MPVTQNSCGPFSVLERERKSKRARKKERQKQSKRGRKREREGVFVGGWDSEKDTFC